MDSHHPVPEPGRNVGLGSQKHGIKGPGGRGRSQNAAEGSLNEALLNAPTAPFSNGHDLRLPAGQSGIGLSDTEKETDPYLISTLVREPTPVPASQPIVSRDLVGLLTPGKIAQWLQNRRAPFGTSQAYRAGLGAFEKIEREEFAFKLQVYSSDSVKVGGEAAVAKVRIIEPTNFDQLYALRVLSTATANGTPLSEDVINHRRFLITRIATLAAEQPYDYPSIFQNVANVDIEVDVGSQKVKLQAEIQKWETSLRDYLSANGVFQSEKIVELISPMIHTSYNLFREHGIIHSDITFNNVYVVDNQLKLNDFTSAAVARAGNTATFDRGRGVPQLMPPEWRGVDGAVVQYTEKIDCWYYGNLIFAMATRKPCVWNDDRTARLDDLEHLPEILRKVVEGLTALDPGARRDLGWAYQTLNGKHVPPVTQTRTRSTSSEDSNPGTIMTASPTNEDVVSTNNVEDRSVEAQQHDDRNSEPAVNVVRAKKLVQLPDLSEVFRVSDLSFLRQQWEELDSNDGVTGPDQKQLKWLTRKRLSAALVGVDRDTFARFRSEQTFLKLFKMLMVVVATIGSFSMYVLLSEGIFAEYQIDGTRISNAWWLNVLFVGIGMLWGAFIFLQDRIFIIQSQRGRIAWWGGLIRFALALVVALTVATPLEMKLFSSSIDLELDKIVLENVNERKRAASESSFQTEVEALQNEVDGITRTARGEAAHTILATFDHRTGFYVVPDDVKPSLKGPYESYNAHVANVEEKKKSMDYWHAAWVCEKYKNCDKAKQLGYEGSGEAGCEMYCTKALENYENEQALYASLSRLSEQKRNEVEAAVKLANSVDPAEQNSALVRLCGDGAEISDLEAEPMLLGKPLNQRPTPRDVKDVPSCERGLIFDLAVMKSQMAAAGDVTSAFKDRGFSPKIRALYRVLLNDNHTLVHGVALMSLIALIELMPLILHWTRKRKDIDPVAEYERKCAELETEISNRELEFRRKLHESIYEYRQRMLQLQLEFATELSARKNELNAEALAYELVQGGTVGGGGNADDTE